MDKNLRYVISATDKSGKTMDTVASKGEKSAHRISSAFSKAGAAIGGEVGDALDKLGEAGDAFEKAGTVGKISAIGATAMGVGGILATMGSKEQAASQQLDQAIQNTGHSADEFSGQIDGVVHHMESYGHSVEDTKGALQTLTQSTKDPQKAIQLMGETADLAAAKHISLGSAATMLARILGGSGSRTLAQYNIALVKNADGTTNWDKTNQALAATLKGQASAAADTFSGRIKGLTTRVEDSVSAFGAHYGPAILGVGTIMASLKPAADIAGGAVGAVKGAFARLTGSAVEAGSAVGTAEDEVAAATTAATGTVESETTAQAESFANVGASAEAAAATTTAATTEMDSVSLAGAGAEVGGLIGSGGGMIGLLGIGAAAALGIGALKLYGSNEKTQIKPTEAFTQAILDDNDALGKNTRALVVHSLESKGAYDSALKLGISQKTLTDAMMGNSQALGEVSAAQHLATIQSLYNVNASDAQNHKARDLAIANDSLTRSIGTVSETLKVNQQAAHNEAAAMGTTKTKADEATSSYGGLARAASYLSNHPALLKLTDQATPHILAIERELDQITGQHWNISVGVNGGGSVSTGRGTVHFNAGGTNFFSGGATHYNEREPEAIVPRGYEVIPTSKVHGRGGAQSITINVNVSGGSLIGSDAAVGKVIAGHLVEHFRNGGNLPNRYGNLATVQG